MQSNKDPLEWHKTVYNSEALMQEFSERGVLHY